MLKMFTNSFFYSEPQNILETVQSTTIESYLDIQRYQRGDTVLALERQKHGCAMQDKLPDWHVRREFYGYYKVRGYSRCRQFSPPR